MTPRSNNTDTEGSDAMGRKTKVRTTIEPGVVLNVGDAELTDLHRLGVIHSSDREGYGTREWVDEADKATDTDEAPASKANDKKGAK